MSESPEVESNYGNPKGKSNLEKGTEQPAHKSDNADPVQAGKRPSNPKMPPSGDLENAGQSDNTKSA